MTREESIKKLEHYRYCLNFQYGWYGKDDDEALDMAIKALEQQPTDVVDRVTIKEYLDSFGKDTSVSATDCVKRQDVEDAIYDYSRSCDVNYEQIIEYIDKLPSVTPQPMSGYISIADAMSAFDDFMCNDIEPEGQEVFLELLKDRAERSKE